MRQRNTIYNGRYTVPTFQEVIDLRDELSKELGRDIGLIPELKHSTYFRSIGLPLEEPLVATLRRNHLTNRSDKVTVQSFEVGNLKSLRAQLPRVPLVQLFDAKARRPGDVLAAGGTLTYGEMATPAGLREVARYADVASPSKDYIVPRDAGGHSLAPTSFVTDAHAAGLDVVAYTFRPRTRSCRSSCAPAPTRSSTATRSPSSSSSSRSASTASSPTTPTSPRRRATASDGPSASTAELDEMSGGDPCEPGDRRRVAVASARGAAARDRGVRVRPPAHRHGL